MLRGLGFRLCCCFHCWYYAKAFEKNYGAMAGNKHAYDLVFHKYKILCSLIIKWGGNSVCRRLALIAYLEMEKCMSSQDLNQILF